MSSIMTSAVREPAWCSRTAFTMWVRTLATSIWVTSHETSEFACDSLAALVGAARTGALSARAVTAATCAMAAAPTCPSLYVFKEELQ